MGTAAANLAADAHSAFWLDPEARQEPSATRIVDAYLAGLTDVGWAGGPPLVRAGFYGVIAAKYPWTTSGRSWTPPPRSAVANPHGSTDAPSRTPGRRGSTRFDRWPGRRGRRLSSPTGNQMIDDAASIIL